MYNPNGIPKNLNGKFPTLHLERFAIHATSDELTPTPNKFVLDKLIIYKVVNRYYNEHHFLKNVSDFQKPMLHNYIMVVVRCFFKNKILT